MNANCKTKYRKVHLPYQGVQFASMITEFKHALGNNDQRYATEVFMRCQEMLACQYEEVVRIIAART